METADHGISSAPSHSTEDLVHLDARGLSPYVDDVSTMMYQETSIMVGLDRLAVFVVGCCCMLLTKFKREELMTPGIRMLSKLEWICGIVLASDQGFAAQSL